VPKRRFLGISFPVWLGIIVVLLGLGAIGLISGALGRSFLGDIGLPSWLMVDKPHPQLPAEGLFHLFGFTITNTMLTAWVSIIVMVAICYAATRRMRLVPSRLQTFVEAVVGWLLEFLPGYCR